jgi:hypothetical protein
MKSWGWLDDTTTQAIAASIAKWREIEAGDREDHGTKDCPLCDLFLKGGCVGCPVMMRTGKPGCDGAPYETEWRPLVEADGVYRADTAAKGAAAKSVIAFLESL